MVDLDNEFWVRIWKLVAITFCVITLAALGSCQSSKYQIRKAIEAGATPVEAYCALNNGDRAPTVCLINEAKAAPREPKTPHS